MSNYIRVDLVTKSLFQLSDLEECRNELDVEEYEELKKDAVAQLEVTTHYEAERFTFRNIHIT